MDGSYDYQKNYVPRRVRVPAKHGSPTRRGTVNRGTLMLHTLTWTNQSSRIVSCCSDWSKSIMTHRGTTIHGTPTRQGTTIHGTPTRQGTMFCRYPDASGNYNSRFPDASGYLVLRFPDASGNLVFLIIIGTLH